MLLVEDIVDTGRTLRYILEARRTRSPKTLEIPALLHKEREEAVGIPVRHVGLPAPSAFRVGYGMDDCGRYRGLPGIGAIEGTGDAPDAAPARLRKADSAGGNPKDDDS